MRSSKPSTGAKKWGRKISPSVVTAERAEQMAAVR
jgi:hypothetical protein